MTRPVELIVANTLHDIAANMERRPPEGFTAADWDDFHASLARTLLCQIAHAGDMAVVEAALAAAGVCGGAKGVGQRMQAVRESRPNYNAPAPPPAEPPKDPVAQSITDVLKRAFKRDVDVIYLGPLPKRGEDA
ncbi:MAG: hypothetical protein AB7S70_02495 [Hyphomicrobium sp.]|uniref:hypothetical protein n=1 Tax=Hyphomicrobium sp. TaxID=82 RepID=UPI003D0F2F74